MKYPKSQGGMWPNRQKTKDTHPNLRGFVEVTEEQIRKLIEMHKAGLEPKLQLAGWTRFAQDTGQKFISISAEAYMKEQDQAAPQEEEFYDDDIPF